MDNLRNEMFSTGFGFVVDYLAEVLRSLRSYDFSDRYQGKFTLSSDISTRDRDGINKTFSGLTKILFPQGNASDAEIEELLRFSIEGRKRVKDQLMRVDATYAQVSFTYSDAAGGVKAVTTLEEEEFPSYYHKTVDGTAEDPSPDIAPQRLAETRPATVSLAEPELTEKHLTFQENQKGVSFDNLFGPYLQGAARVTITDPYLRLFYQVRNLMELLEVIVRRKAPDEEIAVHLITGEDEFRGDQQKENFEKIKESASSVGVAFSWEFDSTGTIHARHIVTDHGWKISLDRGLDIFQQYEMNDAFTFANRLQEYRQCKAFEVTFIRADVNK